MEKGKENSHETPRQKLIRLWWSKKQLRGEKGESRGFPRLRLTTNYSRGELVETYNHFENKNNRTNG
jgi:hypothetical protein